MVDCSVYHLLTDESGWVEIGVHIPVLIRLSSDCNADNVQTCQGNATVHGHTIWELGLYSDFGHSFLELETSERVMCGFAINGSVGSLGYPC